MNRREKSLEAQKQYEKVSGEVYPYELAGYTAEEFVTKLKESGETPQMTKQQAISIAKDELRNFGLPNVPVKISENQGKDPASPYSDATVFWRGKECKIHLHPFVLYTDEEYIREVVRHEVGHIKEVG